MEVNILTLVSSEALESMVDMVGVSADRLSHKVIPLVSSQRILSELCSHKCTAIYCISSAWEQISTNGPKWISLPNSSFIYKFANCQEQAITWVLILQPLHTHGKKSTKPPAPCGYPHLIPFLPITFFSKKKCRNLKKLFKSFLPKVSFSWKIAKRLIFAPYHWCGFALCN